MLFRIIQRSLRQHALATMITALSIALGSGLVMAVFAIKTQSYQAFTGGQGGFDAVLGARGSQLQLVLNTVFHLETSPGNIPWSLYQQIAQDPRVRLAIPYAVGDNYQGFRIVGTTPELFGDGLNQSQPYFQIEPGGRFFAGLESRDAVIGSYVAQVTGLTTGVTFNPYHGLTFDESKRHNDQYTVAGVLKPTNSPSDRVIWIPMEVPSDNQPKPTSFSTKLNDTLKTAVWLGVFIFLGWVGYGWLKGRNNQTEKKTSVNDKINEGWIIGEHDRVHTLVKEYDPINFFVLSDFSYYMPDPWEKPDPKLLAKNVIPKEVKALNGKQVALTGFMLPLNAQADGLTEFILNGKLDMCYFGAPVQMNEWVYVKYVGQGKIPYTHLPLTVFGPLEVGELVKDGHVESLYRLQARAISTPQGVHE
jgi:hypothetical protein